MSLKIKEVTVKETEILLPKTNRIMADAHPRACIANRGLINCHEIACKDCLFYIDNYEKIKGSEANL